MTSESAIAGALLGTFVGDALGRLWEGERAIDQRDGSARVTWSLQHAPLTYTDDTQLALALAEHLCDHPSVDRDDLAATFLDHFQPRRGYGGGMRRLVELWRAGEDVADAVTAIFPDGSYGNGAAMRVAAVGALWCDDLDRVGVEAREQAMTTHVHPLGQDGALAQASAVAVAASAGRFDRDELAEVARRVRTIDFREQLALADELVARWHADGSLTLAAVAAELGNDVSALRSVPVALWVAAVATDPEAGAGLALGIGGDADTIAAMALAVLGAAASIGAIPAAWMLALEDGDRGLSYALDLARRLAESRGG